MFFKCKKENEELKRKVKELEDELLEKHNKILKHLDGYAQIKGVLNSLNPNIRLNALHTIEEIVDNSWR